MSRCALFSLLLVAVPAALRAQSQVVGLRDLAFGSVIPGIQSSVNPNDPIRSGRFYVRHQIARQVQVRFTLPKRLNRVGGGGNMPISFGATDAIAQGTAPTSTPVTFDPNTPITFTLLTSADFYVSLGGTVSPKNNQRTGTYQDTVVLTCTFF